jgi:hypothetical protein
VTFFSLARYGRLLAALALSLICLALTAAAAHAAPVKPLDFAVTSNAPYAGITMHNSYVLTLTNKTKTQELGSANVGLPAGFTLSEFQSDRGSTPVVDGSTLQLRNLSVQPNGDSVHVTMTLQAPCVAPPGSTWTVRAKQSNDFNGTGNDLAPVGGTFGMTVTNQCALRFGAQPADALFDANIRSVDFDPAAASFTVEAVDGRPAAQAQPLEWFTGDIDLARTPLPGSALDSVSGPSFAQPGVATFGTAQIVTAGIYRLLASTSEPGFANDATHAAASAQFAIFDQRETCPANGCTRSRGTSSVTVAPGPEGFVQLSDSVVPEPTCTGYTAPPGTPWYEFFVTTLRDKTITTTYTRDDLKGFKTDLQICFAVPDPSLLNPPFINGRTFNYDNEGSAEGSVALLPTCPLIRTTACVSDRGNLPGGGQFISFWAPASTGDPRYH